MASYGDKYRAKLARKKAEESKSKLKKKVKTTTAPKAEEEEWFQIPPCMYVNGRWMWLNVWRKENSK